MWRDRRVLALMLLVSSCWAACDFGVDLSGLSDGSVVDASLDAPTPSVPVVSLGLGATHSCAARQDGTVVCWGANSYGCLGTGTSLDSSTPTPVLGINDATQVASGAGFSCALRKTNAV